MSWCRVQHAPSIRYASGCLRVGADGLLSHMPIGASRAGGSKHQRHQQLPRASVAHRFGQRLALIRAGANRRHHEPGGLRARDLLQPVRRAPTCVHLARAGLFLANDGVDPIAGQRVVDAQAVRRINAIMMT